MALLHSVIDFLKSDQGVGLLAAIIALDHSLAAIDRVKSSSTGALLLNSVAKGLEFILGLIKKDPQV